MIRMRTLLLELPLTPPGPQAQYGHAWLDTASAPRLQPQRSPLALLPRADARTPVVVIVPAAALSWHRVRLPAGLGRNGPRLQAALQGLLEERLLQDTAQLHMALAPQWQAGQPAWVAVCEKTWLLEHLNALQATGLGLQRLVPELAPPSDGTQWRALGPPNQGWLWCCSAENGVSGWPVAAAAQLPEGWLKDATLLAEPGQAGWAQTQLPEQTQLVDTASHWAPAATGPWDLAQFGLAAQLRQSRAWRWRQGLDKLRREPAWRPARWGLLVLLAAQLVGLHAWAWMTRQQWDAQQAHWTELLQQTFPKVTVVVDAPLQMAREVSRLRQGSGQLGAGDLESLLHALGSALPADVPAPASLSYQDGVLQWPAPSMSARQQTALKDALARQGLQLNTQQGLWQLRSQEVRP